MVVWQITILGVVSAIFLFFAIRSGYRRGQFKEFVWAGVLIVTAYLLGWLFDLLVTAYNGITNLVITQLNNRGVTRIDLASAKWNPDAPVPGGANHGRDITQIIIFIVVALVSYALTTGKPKPGKPGEKPPSAKSRMGALVSFLNVLFILSWIWSRLFNLDNNSVDIGLFQGTTVGVPSLTGANVPFSGINVQVANKRDVPFLDWFRWIPIIIAVLMFFYVLYITFQKPATKTTTNLRIGQFFMLSVVVAVILVFAWQINVLR